MRHAQRESQTTRRSETRHNGGKTMTTPSRAAILTLDELQSQFERLKAKAESFAITGELDRARAVARQALRARDTAEHFAKSEGLR
jgi:phage I-like protein